MPLLLDRWTAVKWLLIGIGVFLIVGVLLATASQGIWLLTTKTICPSIDINTLSFIFLLSLLFETHPTEVIHLLQYIAFTYLQTNLPVAVLAYESMKSSCLWIWFGSWFNELLFGYTWWYPAYLKTWLTSYFQTYWFLHSLELML